MEILKSATFDRWLRSLRGARSDGRVLARIDRLAACSPGDAKPVVGVISALRINHGPGYRVYSRQDGQRLLLLLCCRDKSTQQRDIERTHQITQEWKNHGQHD